MALRRPPTRVEMKADDIDEYSKVSFECEFQCNMVKNRNE